MWIQEERPRSFLGETIFLCVMSLLTMRASDFFGKVDLGGGEQDGKRARSTSLDILCLP